MGTRTVSGKLFATMQPYALEFHAATWNGAKDRQPLMSSNFSFYDFGGPE